MGQLEVAAERYQQLLSQMRSCQPILAPVASCALFGLAQTFYDGLGRAIQTKAESIDGAQNIVSDTRYDGPGQAIETSQPRYVNENATSFFQYTNSGSGALFNHTTTTYDGLGRPRRITIPDGTWTEHAYGVFGDRTYDDVVDPNRHRVRYRHDALVQLGLNRPVVLPPRHQDTKALCPLCLCGENVVVFRPSCTSIT